MLVDRAERLTEAAERLLERDAVLDDSSAVRLRMQELLEQARVHTDEAESLLDEAIDLEQVAEEKELLAADAKEAALTLLDQVATGGGADPNTALVAEQADLAVAEARSAVVGLTQQVIKKQLLKRLKLVRERLSAIKDCLSR